MRGGRFSRGWQLTKTSWRVLRADRSLLAFPVISGICGLVAIALVMVPGLLASDGGERELPVIIAIVAGIYLTTFVATFFNTALAACAARSLEGEDTTVGEGIAAARSRLGPIVGWSLLAGTVGVVLRAIESLADDNVLARIAVSLIGVAWGIASFFAVPVVALEGIGPFDALKRSAGLIRQRWGEGLVGTAAVGAAVVLLTVLPGAVLIAAGVVAIDGVMAAGVALIAGGFLLILVGALLSSAMRMVFRVALYRYATTGEVEGGFDEDQLAGAFAPRRRRRGKLATA